MGFRPFVYRVATQNRLKGYVLNLGDAGVRVVLEGERNNIEATIRQIKNHPPSIARIDDMEIRWSYATGQFPDFRIAKSSSTATADVTRIPPDIATCEDCVRDIFDPNSRWYQYPFTSCAACGPRYSTITDLPYDRPNTTMADFPLCNTCHSSYTDPGNRRYHAQTTACPICGPRYVLLDKEGNTVATERPLLAAAHLLADDRVLALHGTSGTHLVTITSTPEPIYHLRERKRRPQRPLAVMARGMSAVAAFATPTTREAEEMQSWRRPIVLVSRRSVPMSGSTVTAESLDAIAPGLDTIGVMLPYSPAHHILFNTLNEDALVMTSANPTGLPMYIDSSDIVKHLHEIADYFLVHNRRIHQRCDDSVLKYIAGRRVFIRRSRGYVPEPIHTDWRPKGTTVAALGPEEKVTGTIAKAGVFYPTQHIGDTDSIESIEFLTHAMNHLKHLLRIERFDAIACDLHPQFLTTETAEIIAQETNTSLTRVQHHHAHLASLIVDSNLSSNTRIVCITADGYGYGPNGEAWGGEVLVGGLKDVTWYGGLMPSRLSGGDLAARYATRSLIGIATPISSEEQLLTIAGGNKISERKRLTESTLQLLVHSAERGVNAVTTSSAGRFLDAVSVALGICSENTYDGECPMKLESVARDNGTRIRPHYIDRRGSPLIDTGAALQQVLELIQQRVPRAGIAFAAQWFLGEALAQIACMASQEQSIPQVGFSGGVALNRNITRAVERVVSDHGVQLLRHWRVPPGDGGVSVGQSAVTMAQLALE